MLMNSYGALVGFYWLGRTENWERNLVTLPTTNPTRAVLSRPTLSSQRLNACAVDSDGVIAHCASCGWNIRHKTVAPNPSQDLPMWGDGAVRMVRFGFTFRQLAWDRPVTGFESCLFVPVLLSFLSFFTYRSKSNGHVPHSGHYTYRQV